MEEWISVHTMSQLISQNRPIASPLGWSRRRAGRRCRFVVWLHGLGDTGRANEFLADSFPTTTTAAAFADAGWAFPTAPTTPESVRDEEDVLRAVRSVHAMIDGDIAAGTNPQDVFVFGLSQGGALGIASVLLYPKTLGGCAVFSGFLPFNSSFAARVTAQAKKVYDRLGHSLEYYELDYCQRWVDKILRRSRREGPVRWVSRNICLCNNLFNCSYHF
uniref:Phospholipase/carboxylesterase/thioesterase domain-containing protein n=1 Tax=Oryza punctata TaxID=4537 RepID=A0A0E0KWK0_ORYPU